MLTSTIRFKTAMRKIDIVFCQDRTARLFFDKREVGKLELSKRQLDWLSTVLNYAKNGYVDMPALETFEEAGEISKVLKESLN